MKREGKMFDSVSYDKHRRQLESRVLLQKRLWLCITTTTIGIIFYAIVRDITGGGIG